MNTRIKTSLHVLVLASVSLFGIAAAEAGMVSHEFSVTIDTQTTSLFDQAFTADLSLDGNKQVLSEGANVAEPYFLQDVSSSITSMLDTRSHFRPGSAILTGDQSTFEFAILPTHELFAAPFSYDSAADENRNGSLINVRLIGPIPESSIIWLMAGALITLAGLSGGPRIHESV